MSKTTQRLLASYARSFLAAALALYLAGNDNPRDLIAAGIAAIAPPLLRWLNPGDTAFGRGTTR
jgi:hypothetical protein